MRNDSTSGCVESAAQRYFVTAIAGAEPVDGEEEGFVPEEAAGVEEAAIAAARLVPGTPTSTYSPNSVQKS